ncbi:hypothetical protein V8G54_006360 [Vigna mungo]|uniref:Uncharacterized protein n=1 Tax=Vigna mungo TaxID=3915 RepID=A0AAQ3S785_VIGMU
MPSSTQKSRRDINEHTIYSLQFKNTPSQAPHTHDNIKLPPYLEFQGLLLFRLVHCKVDKIPFFTRHSHFVWQGTNVSRIAFHVLLLLGYIFPVSPRQHILYPSFF